MKLTYNEALDYVRENKISAYTYNKDKEEAVVLEFAKEGQTNENDVIVCIFDSGGDDCMKPSDLQEDYPEYISKLYSPFTFEDYLNLEMDLAIIEMKKSEL